MPSTRSPIAIPWVLSPLKEQEDGRGSRTSSDRGNGVVGSLSKASVKRALRLFIQNLFATPTSFSSPAPHSYTAPSTESLPILHLRNGRPRLACSLNWPHKNEIRFLYGHPPPQLSPIAMELNAIWWPTSEGTALKQSSRRPTQLQARMMAHKEP